MHFGGAGVRETGVHSPRNQRANQTFCAVHLMGRPLLTDPRRVPVLPLKQSFMKIPGNDRGEALEMCAKDSQMVPWHSLDLNLAR